MRGTAGALWGGATISDIHELMRRKEEIEAQIKANYDVLEGCLEGTLVLVLILSSDSEPAALCHLLTAPSDLPKASATPAPHSHCASPQPPAMTIGLPSLVRQNYHQDLEAAFTCQINLELYVSFVYLSMSYCFDLDDVALKNFAKYFLHQSHKEREHAEKPVKLQNQ